MNKIFLKISTVLLTLTMLIEPMINVAYAKESLKTSVVILEEKHDDLLVLSPRKEEIGYIYRIVDGVEQRRLWSYTRGVWLEPEWKNV